MRLPLLAAALLALLAQGAAAAPAGTLILTPPRPLGPGEIAWLQVTLGRLGRGREVELKTAEGRELGVVSPFGPAAAAAGGTYALPVPAEAFQEGRLSVVITVTRPGRPPAPPSGDEVRSVSLQVSP